MATLTYNGISFYINEHNATMPVEDFVKHESHHGLKKAELEQVHKDIKKQYNAAKKAEVAPESVVRDADGKIQKLVADEVPAEAAAVVSPAKPK